MLPPYNDVMATVSCPGCQERDQRIAALEHRAAELEATARYPLNVWEGNSPNSRR